MRLDLYWRWKHENGCIHVQFELNGKENPVPLFSRNGLDINLKQHWLVSIACRFADLLLAESDLNFFLRQMQIGILGSHVLASLSSCCYLLQCCLMFQRILLSKKCNVATWRTLPRIEMRTSSHGSFLLRAVHLMCSKALAR